MNTDNFDDLVIREATGKATKDQMDYLSQNLKAWRNALIRIKAKIEKEQIEQRAKNESQGLVPDRQWKAYLTFKVGAAHIRRDIEAALSRVNPLVTKQNIETCHIVSAKREKDAILLLLQARMMIPVNEITERWHLEANSLLDRKNNGEDTKNTEDK